MSSPGVGTPVSIKTAAVGVRVGGSGRVAAGQARSRPQPQTFKEHVSMTSVRRNVLDFETALQSSPELAALAGGAGGEQSFAFGVCVSSSPLPRTVAVGGRALGEGCDAPRPRVNGSCAFWKNAEVRQAEAGNKGAAWGGERVWRGRAPGPLPEDPGRRKPKCHLNSTQEADAWDPTASFSSNGWSVSHKLPESRPVRRKIARLLRPCSWPPRHPSIASRWKGSSRMKSKKGTRLGPGGRWLGMLGTSSPGAPSPVSERRLMETMKGFPGKFLEGWTDPSECKDSRHRI
ncbi:homeobox protein TGIF1 isoform X4 [Pteropus vampyrus]|uniref:Homeobox protein TGIF1 isoform X4 n=1 Tax=Pteropus vampyrus TaxID=132908 RepID=A0A6P6BUL8_PTEVA|nr:homeobox protein TGIF1 isoform X4 [Pteropus vampyrus]